MAGGQMAELTGIYRENWQPAGHPGRGLVMMAFHWLCHPNSAEAANLARGPLNRYLKTWADGVNSADYPGYDKIVAALGQETFESQVASGAAWVGSPADIIEQVRECDRPSRDSRSPHCRLTSIPSACRMRRCPCVYLRMKWCPILVKAVTAQHCTHPRNQAMEANHESCSSS